MRRRKTSEVKGLSSGGRESMNPESADAGFGCPSLEFAGMSTPHIHIGRKANGRRDKGIFVPTELCAGLEESERYWN
jgi:hypothetical protein